MEKNVKSRVIHRHDIEAHWERAKNFIPKQAEIIVYDDRYINSDGVEEIVADKVRYKIGDGVTNVNKLPFANENLVGKLTNDQGAEIFNNYTDNLATGEYSHAEGNSTKAISGNSHAEGARTNAGTKAFKIIALSGTVGGAGTYSLDSTTGIQPGMRYSAVTSVAAYDCGEITAIEGNMVKVDNYPGHGINTEDDNPSNFNLYNLFIIVDHPELGTINAGFNAHTEGSNTYAAQVDAHAEGRNTRALGKYSHTEGISTQAGHAAHAEGSETKAIGVVAHAEGAETVAQGNYTHAEGFKSQAVGGHSHAEGQQTTSTGTAAHSEGGITVASGDYSHAEGGQTTAQGAQSHSEGYLTKAIGQQSHAEGYNTQAIGNRSHAGGRDTVANYNDQFVIGRYNSNKEDTLFEVGNGSANSRANAFEVKANGTVYSQGGKLATETYVNEKINSGGTSTQADWNESDSNAAGYVKNRTHYGLQNPEISIPYDAGSPYGQSNYYYDLVSKDGQYIHVHRYNAFGLDEWYKLFVDRYDYSMSDDTPPSPGLAFVEVASKFHINSCGYPYEVWYDTGTIGIEEYDNTQCVYDIYNELVPAEKVLDPRYLPMNVITEGVKSGVSEEIDSKLASLVDSAPETLNTLNELADALGDDPNFATTMATEIGKKVDKVDGKVLSTNDFTNEYKNQIDSHNFGDNNTLNVETIGVLGDNNIIGCKAYRILKYRVDEANNKTYVQVDGNSEIVNIPVGTPVTLIFDETATRVANTVDSITYAENATEIVLDKAWVEYHYENTDVRTQYVDVLTGDDYDNLLIFPTYPSIGTTPYGGNGYVAGSDNSALMIYSTAFGKDNSAEGKYGTTIGRENAAGYAAFASGRKCKALGTHSHAEGSGSSVKEIEAGTTVLGKYTIPANFEWNDGNGGHAEGFGTTASNNATHAEGYETYAIGSTSHAEGFRAIASGDHSHAEGVGAWSSGKASHAEGSETLSQGENAHAEGRGTKATGNSAHAEGQETEATKNGAHAEGSATKAYGSTAHAEGYDTEASGDQSHAQNYQTVASGWASTAIGHTTKAGYSSQFVAGQFNENKESNLFEIGKGTGENNRANAFEVDRNGNVIAAGNITSANGTLATETFVKQSYVIAGNKDNSSIGGNSTIEGSQNIVVAGTSHAEGESNTITSAAGRAHAEGYNNTVTAWHAHAEGALNTVSGANGHAEGVSNSIEVEGENGHAEGNANIVKGVNAHAEGYGTVAEGNHSHTQNYETKATAWATSAAGQGTVAGYTQQFVVGAYNANKEENIFEVGRGTGENNRKNAFEVDRNGNARANDKAVVTSSDATPMEIVLRAGQPTDEDRVENTTIIWIDTSALSNGVEEW